MLANGDPIEEIANFIAGLVKSSEPLIGNRVYGAMPKFPVLTALLVRVKWRSRRLISYSWSAVHSLLSAVKTVLMYLAGFLRPRGRDQEQQQYKQVLSEVLQKLNRMIYLFSQGFKDTNYFNPVTHENDTFTEVDVAKRVGIWKRILAND